MKKTIYCRHCCGEIESRSDLVVVTNLFELTPYHEKCYAKEMKTVNSIFLAKKPLNSSFATYTMLIFAPILLVLACFMSSSERFIIIAAVVIGLGTRAYSWLKYERYLK